MGKRLPTSEKLARALEELNDPKLEAMIKRAREGFYDDYKSTIASPIVQLVADLRNAGHPMVAEQAKNGEWEPRRWEAEEWFEEEGRALLRREWPGKKRKVDTV